MHRQAEQQVSNQHPREIEVDEQLALERDDLVYHPQVTVYQVVVESHAAPRSEWSAEFRHRIQNRSHQGLAEMEPIRIMSLLQQVAGELRPVTVTLKLGIDVCLLDDALAIAGQSLRE